MAGKRSRQRRPLTGFGRVLRELAEDEGYHSWPALAEALTAAGYNADPPEGKTPGVSRTTVNNWAVGATEVPKAVMPYLETVLKLDKESKRRLGNAFAWEQDFSELGAAA